jgi:tetratricopeptide (TPR) repeat protein
MTEADDEVGPGPGRGGAPAQVALEPGAREPERPVPADLPSAYQALSGPERRFFRLLGLHPGAEMGLAAAATLANLSPAHAQPLMAALAAAHLVEALPTRPQRYRMRDAVGAFALEQAERAESADELRLARRRALQWYLHGSYLAGRYMDPDCYRALDLAFTAVCHQPPVIQGPRAALEWYEREWTNLLCTAEAAAEHGYPDILWQLAATMRHAHLRADRFEAGLALQRAALASSRRQRNRHAEAVTLESLSLACWYTGRLAQARESNQAADALWQVQGNRLRAALARLAQVRMLMGDRDWPAAIPLGWSIVSTAESLGERRLEAAALGALAECYAETCRYEEARLLLHEAVAIYRKQPWAVGLADALWNTSRVLRSTGRPAAALGPARDALAQAELTADAARQGRTLLELGVVWQANGHDEKALAAFQRATARARLSADRGGEARALGSVARYYRDHGDLSAAHAFDERAVEVARAAGDRWQQALGLEQSAETLDRLNQSVAAGRARQQAYALFEAFDEPKAHQARGRLAAALAPGRASTLGGKRQRSVPDGG